MKYYIGVDVSKLRLDVDWCGKPVDFANNSQGIFEFTKQLSQLMRNNQLAVVICEASGGYEQKLVHACHADNIPFHVAHANHIKYFSKSQGIKAKTDQIDAKMITAYGTERKLEADTFLLNEKSIKIKQLLKRREQLLLDKKREQCRIDKIDSSEIIALIKDHINWISQSIKKLEDSLSKLVKSDEIKEHHALLTTIPGVGKILASYLITHLPELGKLSNKAISALAGVAPFNNDSGKHQGKRYIQGGRSMLRKMLYMAAMTAIKHNPELRSFYQRLSEAGKPGKVALVAIMRKLLSIANSIIRRKSDWKEIY